MTVHAFRTLETEVLVATDLLARGIDIDDVALVVNFDLPREPEDYVHRIGRTGRANADGSAISLVGPKDRRAYSNILATLKIKIPTEGMGNPTPRQQNRRDGKGRGQRRDEKQKNETKEQPAETSAAPKDSKPRHNNKRRNWHRRPNK